MMAHGAVVLAFWMAIWTGVLAAHAGWPGVQAQAEKAEGSTNGSQQGAGTAPWNADATVHSTAEDVLAALQKLRPRNEPITPASRAHRAPDDTRAKLWPEGTRVIHRPGQLIPSDVWWTFTFDGVADVGPLKLLPNATLEAMVRMDATGGQRYYELSGELTVFEGENYVLARYATRPLGGPPKPTHAEAESDGSPVQGHDAARAHDAAAAPVATDASAEDVLAILAAQEPAAAMMTTFDSDADGAGLHTPRAGQPAMMDGTPLVRRPGRVVLDGRWWTFLVESEKSEFPEPPLRLLPNLNMELMVQAVRANSTGVVFIVSGEVLAYGGDNYLLARSVLRRPELGNLRK